MRCTIAAILLANALAAHAGHDGHVVQGPARLYDGLGAVHHPISTRNAEAQRFFDQGLALVFAFNYDEARRSFQRAAALDPRAAMPWWGVALTLGPNYNMEGDAERTRAAHAAIAEARRRAARATAAERAYVEALAARYTDDPGVDPKRLAAAYTAAMADLVARYPDDLDAATLYADSMMNLRPWQLWTPDGEAAEGTEQILAVLEGVLRRAPNHIGANHLYIHATEASPHPERALPSAARLPRLAPGAGHLVHMPAHVYIRTGDYPAAARSNEEAIAADRAYLAGAGDQRMYVLMYATHNVHFLAAAEAMAGRGDAAQRAAGEAARQALAHAGPPTALDPFSRGMVEMFTAMPIHTAVRFRRWQELLAMPEPEPGLPVTRVLWHAARGQALAARGNHRAARAERAGVAAATTVLPADATLGLNRGRPVAALAAAVLDARLAEAAGDDTAAIAAWERAVALQDGLGYNEPPDWPSPVRESLGGALLRADRPADAEAVFRADLAKNPRNPRSLFGLRESLRAQRKREDAAALEPQVAAAGASGLRVEDL